MLKNLTIYRIGPNWTPRGDELAERLRAAAFVPCGASQPASFGWQPPRGEAHGLLLESVAGQWLLQLGVEQRVLPASVVRRRLDETAARIERETGRKPGKKQRTELKEQIVHELLPRAFTRQSAVTVWIDPKHRLLMLDATSAGRIDQVLSALVEAADDLVLQPIQTATSPAAAMAGWLTSGAPPATLTVDRECELKAADESQAAVRYARHPLDIEEIRQHIAEGKRPTRLALTWQGRVSFVLNEALQLRRIAFLDGVFEGRAEEPGGFDANAAIATGELGRLIPELLDALGGEQQAAAEALAA